MPTAYTPLQKAAIQRYIEIANVDKATAARTLKQHNWDVQAAANRYVLWMSSSILFTAP